jgi:hypothetical protein
VRLAGEGRMQYVFMALAMGSLRQMDMILNQQQFNVLKFRQIQTLRL